MKKTLIRDAGTGLPAFLHNIATQKCACRGVSCFHFNQRFAEAKLAELVQVVEYAFQGAEVGVVAEEAHGELLVSVAVAVSQARPVMSAALGMYFPEIAPKVRIMGSDSKGIEQLSQIVGRWGIGAEDRARVALTRLQREGNVFVLLDDDPMVLRQMEQVLKGFGHVEKALLASEFLVAYERYAPNAVFIDIHLRDGNGIDVANKVRTELDAHGHVVMITADAVKDRVADAKSCGAKGFLAKPISKEALIRHVMNCPTFVKRAM